MNNLKPLMSSARTGDSSKDEWQTPKWLFNLLNREFRFTLDPAATKENALCDNFFTLEEDGLKQSWIGHTVFVNPPYSQLKAWVRKGYEESEKGHATVVMLIPARTDTAAWWDYVRWGDVRFLKGRLRFEGAINSAPFPSAIVAFEKGEWYKHHPTTFYWDIPKEKKTENSYVDKS